MTTDKPLLRTSLIVAAAAFAIITPIAQALGAFGLSAAEFSSSGDSTLRAEGYAFSIWGLIYLGLGVYAIRQALPGTKPSAALDRFGWPSVVAMAGCGVWLLAAAADARWATVVIIALSALALIVPLMRVSNGPEPLWIVAPLGLLGGWLTIATALNLLTVLTSYDFIPTQDATIWAIGAEFVVLIIGLGVLWRSKNIGYGLAIAWGLVGVVIAEHAHRPEAALVAGSGAALIALVISIPVGRYLLNATPLERWRVR